MSYDFNDGLRYAQGTFTTQRDSEGMTIVAWIKVAAADWAVGQTYGVIVGNDAVYSTGTVDNSVRFSIGYAAADEVSALSRTTGDSSARRAFTDGTFDSVWVPVACVFTANNDRDVYIGNETVASNATERIVGAALDTIFVGASTGGYSNFAGLLAEVTIFNKALNATEVSNLYTENAGSYSGPPPPSVAPNNVIAYYPLDYSNSTQTNDATGTAADATGDLTVTGATYSSDHPNIVGGGLGGANRGIMRGVARGVG